MGCCSFSLKYVHRSIIYLHRSEKCDKETTQWSACSVSCGMGVSMRMTNDNEDCTFVEQRRLCLVRPCELNDKHLVSDKLPLVKPIFLSPAISDGYINNKQIRLYSILPSVHVFRAQPRVADMDTHFVIFNRQCLHWKSQMLKTFSRTLHTIVIKWCQDFVTNRTSAH